MNWVCATLHAVWDEAETNKAAPKLSFLASLVLNLGSDCSLAIGASDRCTFIRPSLWVRDFFLFVHVLENYRSENVAGLDSSVSTTISVVVFVSVDIIVDVIFDVIGVLMLLSMSLLVSVLIWAVNYYVVCRIISYARRGISV